MLIAHSHVPSQGSGWVTKSCGAEMLNAPPSPLTGQRKKGPSSIMRDDEERHHCPQELCLPDVPQAGGGGGGERGSSEVGEGLPPLAKRSGG